MTLDVFIHPDFALQPKQNKPHIARYHNELVARRNISDAVLLSHGADCRWNKHFGANSVFRTLIIDYDENQALNRRHSGYVMGKDWNDFASHIDDQDVIRIHGSYLGFCILSFARQLQAYLSRGIVVPNYTGEEKNIRERLDEIYGIPEEIEAAGKFSDLRMKLGTVLMMDGDVSDEAKLIGPNESYPFGNYVYQMSDDNTQIHGKEYKLKYCK